MFQRALGFVFVLSLTGVCGCASTVKQAAKEAAPTALNASVKEVHNPATRSRMADVLSDPEIRTSTASLAQAVADGVLNALTEKERVERTALAGDVFVEHMSRSFAKSMEHDFSPMFAKMVNTSIDRTFDQARGAEPALKAAIGELAREAGKQAALGFQDAVMQSEQKQKQGEAPPGAVLATVGRTSDVVARSASIVTLAVVAAVVLAVIGGFTWLFVRLRHEKLLNNDLRRRLAV